MLQSEADQSFVEIVKGNHVKLCLCCVFGEMKNSKHQIIRPIPFCGKVLFPFSLMNVDKNL